MMNHRIRKKKKNSSKQRRSLSFRIWKPKVLYTSLKNILFCKKKPDFPRDLLSFFSLMFSFLILMLFHSSCWFFAHIFQLSIFIFLSSYCCCVVLNNSYIERESVFFIFKHTWLIYYFIKIKLIMNEFNFREDYYTRRKTFPFFFFFSLSLYLIIN